MKKEKQIRVLGLLDRGVYGVVGGRVMVGDREKVASVVGGYRQHILFGGRGWGREVVYEHHVVWLSCRGVFDGVIDHLNGDRGDNRIENLECVSVRENVRRSRKVSAWSCNKDKIKVGLDLVLGGMSYNSASKASGVNRLSLAYTVNRLVSGGFSRYMTHEESVRYGERLRRLQAR